MSLVAWVGAALTLVLIGGALFLGANPPPGVPGLDADTVLFALQYVPLVLAGALIASMRPAQPIGWLLVAMGLVFGTGGALTAEARHLYGPAPAAGALLVLASNQFFKLGTAGVAVLMLLFPTGSLPSRGWRWLLVALGILLAVAITSELIRPGPITDYLVAHPPVNPLGIPGADAASTAVGRAGFPLFAIAVALAATSLVVRYRRSGLEQRLQLKWFGLAASLWAAIAIADGAYRALGNGHAWPTLPLQAAYDLGAGAMAVGIAIALLRHRLFDVDLVISRTVAFALLAAMITVFYVVAVAAVGTMFATGSSSRLVLAVLATACVAAAFQPLRARLEHWGRGLVYGQRAAPYEVLAAFAERLPTAMPGQDLVPDMARTLAQGTGCDSATIWLREHDAYLAVANWPDQEPVTQEMATHSVPVIHGGEELGRLAVRRLSGARLGPTEERLMAGLAAQAGLAFKNEGLQQELRQRLAELQMSRQRLVAVQDDERRRIERDLHDGAQQDLVALRIKLGLASAMARNDGSAGLQPVLDELQRDAGTALDSLRELSRGVYPALLEAEGLRAALAARARSIGFAIELRCQDGRFPRNIEGALYFCISEALQNVVKHAEATRVSVHVWATAGSLHFEVKDDGRGASGVQMSGGRGIRNMRDRIEALGGRLEVSSVGGEGFGVNGDVPLPQPSASYT